jgi:hypothetical protein
MPKERHDIRPRSAHALHGYAVEAFSDDVGHPIALSQPEKSCP